MTYETLNRLYTVVFCVGPVLIVTAIMAIFGIRARLRYADQIFQQARTGAFKDWSKPGMATRIRTLIVAIWVCLAIAGGLALLVFLNPFALTLSMSRILIAMVFIVLLIGAFFGYLLQRTLSAGSK